MPPRDFPGDSIELVRPGFEVARREVEVVRGETTDVLVELRP